MKPLARFVSLFGGAIATVLMLWCLRRAVRPDDATEAVLQQGSLPPVSQRTGVSMVAIRPLDGVAPQVPNKSERLRMSKSARIKLLEELGCVPEDGDRTDFFLAEKTSWWGKRFDPDAFWEGRVLWYDASAQRDARRYGRAYPPIPYEDPSVAQRSDEDRQVGVMSGESSSPRSFYSEREAVFWDRFGNSHPKPPDQIQPWLERCASAFVYKAYLLESEPTTARKYRLSARDLSLDSDLREARSSFYPHECVSPETYKWAYVMKGRREFEDFKAAPWGSDPWQVPNFLGSVYVDHALITDPLTPEQIRAADAWKVAYVRRLRSEKWDESYIAAYKEAWSLTEEDLAEPVAERNENFP